MRLIKVIAIVLGLGVFAIVIILGILTVNNPSPLYVALLGISVATLAPTGFELYRFAFSSGDKEYRFFFTRLSWLFLCHREYVAGNLPNGCNCQLPTFLQTPL